MSCFLRGSFQSLIFFLAFLLLCTSVLSCRNNQQQEEINQVLKRRPDGVPDEERDADSKSEASCKRSEKHSEEVTVRELDFVDTGNVGEYTIRGTCEEENLPVYVTVNGYKTSKNPICDRRKWATTLNLTPLSFEFDEMSFHITHNRETICKEVGVLFQGPKNYIPIPPREDYYESSFFVMKYEAKIEGLRSSNAKAVSHPKDRPVTRISHDEALQLCQNNGSRYNLITNLQWQNIALSIEEEDENWSQGRSTPSDGNALNCGVSIGNPRPADEECAVSSCSKGWDENRRTHILTTGEKIWDMCGNVGEIVKDKYRKNYEFNDYIYQLYSESQLYDLFGPRRSYRLVGANRRSNTWNLGYATIKKGKDLIVRGLPGRDTGVFSVDITQNQISRRGYSGNIGFRCVYNP